MKARPYSPWLSRAFIFAMTALAFTGLLQMPLAKRYYLTDVPGLAWTGDFFLVHKLHYVFATLLLFIVALAAINWLLGWRKRLKLTGSGTARVVILAGLIISGGLRVYRNLPGVTLDPTLIVTIEWVHICFALGMAVTAIIALIKRSSAYATWK